MKAEVPVAILRADNLEVGYGNRTVMNDLTLTIQPHSVTALVGPNGSGKSTLLKTLARLMKPGEGAVYLNGKALTTLSTTTIARHLAILPQGPSAPAGLTVRELVEQGRFPHVGALRMLRHQDHQAIREALAVTGMSAFAHRPVDALSGGERQRAWIALALAQDTPLLLLDEPTTFLDIGHQLEVLELVRHLNQAQGKTIILVLHDLNHAARYSDRMVVLQQGVVVADGVPSAVLTTTLLRDVFKVHAHITHDPINNVPICMPYAPVNAPTAPLQNSENARREPVAEVHDLVPTL
jgi:iron complex transport system ATP-binding protein